jgi:hypothetical protein
MEQEKGRRSVSRKKEDSLASLARTVIGEKIHFQNESEVDGSIFDEYDPNDDTGAPLRTLIDFTICKRDKPEEMVAFDDIENHPNNLILRGTVVEPYPLQWREAMLSLLSTTNLLGLSDRENADEGKTTDGQPLASPPVHLLPSTLTNENKKSLDWDTLKDGDMVDGYCYQTNKWFPAKVVGVDSSEASPRYKVHFQGWNSKYDEWISKYSERLVPFQSSQFILNEAERESSLCVPWFDCGTLVQRCDQKLKSSGVLPTPLENRRITIEIDGVDDYCLDLTYANPSLWIIAKSGVWYRVAGPFVPERGCAGWPNSSYLPFFSSCYKKYLTTAHVAMSLLDLLPSMPNIAFATIAEEIRNRSEGRVNELSILSNAEFVLDQLQSLSLPESWSSVKKKPSIEKSLFVQQMKKEKDSFDRCGGLIALKVSLG